MLTLIHGGMTGVDRGAHEAAIDNGWSVSGYMPRGARDEYGKIPPDVARFLREHESSNYAARTEANVRSCDALLVVVHDANDPYVTPGTAKTIDLAISRNLRRMIVDPSWSALLISEWIWCDLMAPHAEQLSLLGIQPAPVPMRLMIAGPRESKWPGARVETAALLRRVGVELGRRSHPLSGVQSV
jgi:Circularly permutated YpsA SLOG family